MTREENSSQGRRNFLRTAALTAVAATAAGVGAAKLTGGMPAAPLTTSSMPVMLPEVKTVLTGSEDMAELFSKLAAAQAENVRLQAELDAAQRSLSSWQQTNSSSATQMETLSVELDKANGEIGVLSGLVALYEQLDDVDVAELMTAGVTAVSESINSLAAASPLLAEGIVAGQQALDELEAYLPLVENGRLWLERHNEKLQDYFANLESLLQNAVERIEPFLDMLTHWFEDVRKWLPFNLGQKAINIMASATTLLSETPHTISGLDTNVMQPLDQWLGYEEDEVRLSRHLIKPLREKVISKADAFNQQALVVKQTYEEKVATPLETAVSQRRALQDMISQYRQQNQL